MAKLGRPRVFKNFPNAKDFVLLEMVRVHAGVKKLGLYSFGDDLDNVFANKKHLLKKSMEQISKTHKEDELSQELFPPSQEGAEPEGHECVVVDLVGTPDIIGASYPEVNLCIDTNS